MDSAVADGRLKVRDIELEWKRAGTGAPLLMLHGGSGPQGAAPFARKLAQSFDLMVPTHPGFAETALPDGFDSIHDLAYLYLDLMDQLDLRDVALMGFSMGGWLAMEIAIRSTARIAKLILVDSVGIKFGGPTTRDIADIFAMSAEESQALMFHDPSKMPGVDKLTDQQLVHMMRARRSLALYGWEPFLHNPKLKGRLHRIDVPTLVIWGESDGLVTPDYGRQLADAIPGAQFALIAEAGHAPQMEQPAKFNELVETFAA